MTRAHFVHRRLWPALVRLADGIGADRLAQVREVHDPSGRHTTRVVAFPAWVPAEIVDAAARLSVADAEAALSEGVRTDLLRPHPRRR